MRMPAAYLAPDFFQTRQSDMYCLVSESGEPFRVRPLMSYWLDKNAVPSDEPQAFPQMADE